MPELKAVKEIPVLFYFENKDTRTVIAKGWNGILYRRVKTLGPSDDGYQLFSSDEDLTEPGFQMPGMKENLEIPQNEPLLPI